MCSLNDTFLEFFSNQMTVNFDELYSLVKDTVGRYMMATLLSQYNLTGYKYSILSYINKFFNQVWSDLTTSTGHRSVLSFCWGARNCCLFLSLPRYGQPPKKDTVANDSLSSAFTTSPEKSICAISRWVMSRTHCNCIVLAADREIPWLGVYLMYHNTLCAMSRWVMRGLSMN